MGIDLDHRAMTVKKKAVERMGNVLYNAQITSF